MQCNRFSLCDLDAKPFLLSQLFQTLLTFCIESFVRCHCRSDLGCIDSEHCKSKCPCFGMKQYYNKQCRCRNCANLDRVRCLTQRTFCRCGSKKKLEDITSCCNMTYQKRATKCPCFKSMRPCSMDCQCKGCRNTYGKKSEKEKVSPQGKKRINRENKKYNKKRTSEYMKIEIGKEAASGWTLLKTTTLYYAITYLQVRCEEVDLFSVVATSQLAQRRCDNVVTTSLLTL